MELKDVDEIRQKIEQRMRIHDNYTGRKIHLEECASYEQGYVEGLRVALTIIATCLVYEDTDEKD